MSFRKFLWDQRLFSCHQIMPFHNTIKRSFRSRRKLHFKLESSLIGNKHSSSSNRSSSGSQQASASRLSLQPSIPSERGYVAGQFESTTRTSRCSVPSTTGLGLVVILGIYVTLTHNTNQALGLTLIPLVRP